MLAPRFGGGRKLPLGATAAVLFLVSALADACPVCFGAAGDDALRRYVMSWVVLSSLPLLIFASVLVWVWRCCRTSPNEPPDARLSHESSDSRS